LGTITVPATQCSFEELGLQAGDRLHLEIRSTGTPPRTYFTNLIGHIPSASLLVRTPLSQGFPLGLSVGDPLEVRVFSGRHSCTFNTSVVRLCRAPVHYLHLAYPDLVQRVLVRSALRVRVNLPGMAAGASNGTLKSTVPITVTDLSISGALVDASRELGDAGDSVDVAFKFFVQPNDYLVNFEAKATIQSTKESETSVSSGLRYGLRFGAMHATEGVLLQSYLHQIILEDRSRFA
jgi:hypothetical protein